MSIRLLGFLGLSFCAALTAGCTAAPSCEVANGGCAAEASCVVAGETVSCTCKPGFEGDGRTCTDVDECPRIDCGPNMSCRNTPGSATCECLAGFTPGDAGCVDVDECATNPCQANAACTNTPGAYECACKPGFKADGTACVDVDECAAGADDCGAHATCTNADGSFACACDVGYVGDGRRCDPSVLAGTARFFGNLDTDHDESIASCPRRLADGKVVFFSAGDGTGTEPFVVANGTTSLVRDLTPGASGSYVGCLPGTPGGKVLFFADDGSSGIQLWATDGTSGGTAPVCAPSSGVCPGSLTLEAVAYQGKFLIAEDEGASRKLWRYDPSTGTLTPFASGLAARLDWLSRGLELSGGKLLACDLDRMIVIHPDGTVTTVGGDDSVSRTCASQRSSAPASIGGRGVYLMRSGSSNQFRFFSTDGATSTLGTTAYYLLTPDIGVFGGKAYFVGRPITATENRLMEWDGDVTHPAVEVVATTPAGPVHVTPLRATPRGRATDMRWIVPARRDGSSVLEFYALSSTGLAWLATTALEPTDYGLDPHDGLETSSVTLTRIHVRRSRAGTEEPGTVWVVSDGTSGDTHVFEVGTDMIDASVDGQGFLVSAKVPGSPKGTYAWQPSTPTGLSLVGAALGPERGASPSMLGFTNGRWFLSREKEGTTVLAATNGTLDTTDLLAGPAQGCGFVVGSRTAVLGGAFYFVCAARRQATYTDHSLWRSDGTRQGTVRLMGEPGDAIDSVTAAAGRVFVALRSSVGSSLAAWDPARSAFDRQLAAVQVGTILGEYNGSLYFRGRVSATGEELWHSDGTAAGTALVADLSLGSPSSAYTALGVAGGKLVFCARPSGGEAGLYAYDGTNAAPSRFYSAPGFDCRYRGGSFSGGRLFVPASSTATGEELLVTDGTEAGTAFVDLTPGAEGTRPNDALVNPVTQRLFFRNGVDDALYETDGTVGGTRKVVPETAQGTVAEYVVAGRGLLMLVEDATRSASVLEAWEEGAGKAVPVDYGALGAGYFKDLSFAEGRAFVVRASPTIGMEALVFEMPR